MSHVLTLCIPAKSDSERDAVAAACQARGGEVVALDRFWDPPPLEQANVRPYGNDTFCLVVAQKLGLTLISPPDDLLLRLGPYATGRVIEQQTLSRGLLGPFPAFIKPLVPKVFRAAIYEDAESLRAEANGLALKTPILNWVQPLQYPSSCEIKDLRRLPALVSARYSWTWI